MLIHAIIQINSIQNIDSLFIKLIKKHVCYIFVSRLGLKWSQMWQKRASTIYNWQQSRMLEICLWLYEHPVLFNDSVTIDWSRLNHTLSVSESSSNDSLTEPQHISWLYLILNEPETVNVMCTFVSKLGIVYLMTSCSMESMYVKYFYLVRLSTL